MTFVEGESILKAPVAIKGLKEDEFFFPDSIGRGDQVENLTGSSGYLRRPMKGQSFSALKDMHSQFARTVDVEKVWEQLRESVPEHESWVPSERGRTMPHSLLSFTKGTAAPDDLSMGGSIYRVKRLDTITMNPNKSKGLGGGLRFTKAEDSQQACH